MTEPILHNFNDADVVPLENNSTPAFGQSKVYERKIYE